ncbi:hypothetical protein GW17_00056928 [Ensete ventricosum]|nr:hypothetical protein GW17_00056928 [Ensete ventricosum]
MSIAALHLLLRSAPAPATALAAAFVVGILLLARRRRSNSPPVEGQEASPDVREMGGEVWADLYHQNRYFHCGGSEFH